MFWGLIMEPNKRYTQTVEKSFHVSMASLDLTTADDNLVQVMLCYDDRNYLLCSLNKNSTWQVPLDLNFEEGTKIAFTCNGHGHVHLTGYLIPDENLDLDELEEEDDDDDDEVPQLVDRHLKRKAKDLKNKKKIKRPKQEIEAESSDEDIELDGTNEDNDTEDSFDEYQTTMLNEKDEDDDEDDDEEDEEDEEDEDDEEDKKIVKSQQKDKKNKQQQKKKEDKKKLVNGKELKQDQQTKQKKNKDHQSNDQNVQSDQKKRVIEGGVLVEELKIGNGTPAKSGKFVSVYYVGRLKNGRKFDSTTQGEGFKFRLGKGEVIKGWDVGIIGMKVGGKRCLTIPPAMGYGARGSPPVIPSNSTLIFEIELRNVH